MNAYLALTKHLASYPKSKLEQAVTKPASRQTFYTNYLNAYYASWLNKDEHKTLQHKWYDAFFELHYSRLSQMAGEHLSNRILRGRSPLVTGQGQPSVLETHLALHPTYGIPYITGTALKGISAHYCHRYLGEEDEHFRVGGAYYERLYGTVGQMGSICYHDAWVTPATVSKALSLDVLTPHHKDYNQIVLRQAADLASVDMAERDHPLQAYRTAVEKVAPHDDDTPVPVHFVSVQADFKLLLTSSIQGAEGMEWLQIAAEILAAAVQHEGVGGKTNAGYGKMVLEVCKEGIA
ncbi:type III-B CRISPR module RAMP protein Cmr6 [Paenibacillus taiwanensis]|uniref:type III-B CRISPR module RAMP protein Cmr6 n=1 Tax=Paenibacillus taiwanensis TaxID=401638 RepID=UPI000422AA7B|nr:type III-B CRISPR module RAMP protein Cmr6 [Paenibacillus taiwanensis]